MTSSQYSSLSTSSRQWLKNQGEWLFRWRSYLPLLVLPIVLIALKQSEYVEQSMGEFADALWESFCIILSFIGLGIRCMVVGYTPTGTSGRNTREQEAKTLNITGMYSIVRHPLYLGNFIITLGLTLFIQVWWLALIIILAFWLYYERIIFAEEEFLYNNFGDLFLEWAAKTHTFIPIFKNWRKPAHSFSFKNILKREYTGFFQIIALFTIIEIVGDILVEGKLELDSIWLIFFIIGLITYLVLLTLKRKTKILNLEGR